MQGVHLEMYVCVFLQVLHFGAARCSVLVEAEDGWGCKAFSVSSPQHAWQSRALLASAVAKPLIALWEIVLDIIGHCPRVRTNCKVIQIDL